jgi:FAD/FMN-containing dehydrogenase
VVPVGAATSYWDPLRVEGAIVLDVTTLREPWSVDATTRVAHVGAGCTVREVDRAARRHGLCVMARPDSGGDSPVGALLAVGSTAGLGMGAASALDSIGGATVVTGRGETLRLGASHALHGVPFCRHGLPDGVGLLAAAQGRGAIVTELGLLLHPAPCVVTARGRGRAELGALLAAARAALDDGRLESHRIEAVSEVEVMARTIGRRDRAEAVDAAEQLAARWRAAGLPVDALDHESEAARRGEDPAYEYHWLFPAPSHRQRLLGGALWGVEVTASWRDIDACAARLWRLYGDLAGAPLIARRLALYPSHHAITAGVQVIVRREPASINDAVQTLSAALPDLLEHGAIPYRPGHLWNAALKRHRAVDPMDAFFELLDPDGVLRGPA